MTGLLALIARPNALDREVSAIPVHDLLTQSPFELVDPARAAAAAHLEQTQLFVWIAMVALQIGVLAWFWSSGNSGRLRDALRAKIRSEFWVRFCFGAALAFVDKALAFIPLAMQYRFLRIMGLTEILFRSWLADWILSTLVAMVVAGLIAAAVLWLADRTHQWYIYTLVAIVGLTVFVAYISPLVAAPPLHEPAMTRSLAADVTSLRARTHTGTPVMQQDLSARTRLATAYVSGLGTTQRIVVSDTMLASASEPEMRFIIARAMAWIAGNEGLHLALIQAAIIVLGVALAVTISDRIGFRRDDDPVSRLALLGALIGCVYLVAAPFYNGYTRSLDVSSDTGALATTGDRASAVRLQVRRADESLVPVCPDPISYWYLNEHPSPGARISAFQGVADVCSTLLP